MGKKLSSNQASTKISKNDKKKQQHQLNTMIQILRPKVYITHSSDFKRLVQDLTGNCPPLSTTPPVVHQPPIIENIGDEDYQYLHVQETTSPDFSIDVSSDDDTSNNSNNNTLLEKVAYTMGEEMSYNHVISKDYTSKKLKPDNFNYNLDILSYDSPSLGDIVVPENLSSMLLEEECFQNNMENHNFPVPPCSDDIVSLSPPSSSSSDWQLEMTDPFYSYNFYEFDDACYHSFYIPKDQALYHQQEVCFFDENIELLQW